MMKQIAATLPAILLLAALPASGGPIDACPAGGAAEVNPLLNGDFRVGVKGYPATDPVQGDVIELFGSLVPGLTETNGLTSVPPWTITVAREDRFPESLAGWSESGGIGSSGAMWIHYDSRDSGHAALRIAQGFGSEFVGGVYCGADDVTLRIRTDRPILVMAQVHTDEQPHLPHFSPATLVPATGPIGNTQYVPLTLDLPPGAQTLTRFELLLSDAGNGASDGAWVHLDDIVLRGTSIG